MKQDAHKKNLTVYIVFVRENNSRRAALCSSKAVTYCDYYCKYCLGYEILLHWN